MVRPRPGIAETDDERRQIVLAALDDGASRTWTRGEFSFTVANPHLRTLHGSRVFTAEVTVTRNGVVLYDDRVNMPNPSLYVITEPGDPTADPPVPPTKALRPLEALRIQLLDTVRAATGDFRNQRLERNADGTFKGDTLSVRSSTADGVIESGPSPAFGSVLSGTSLDVDTTEASDNSVVWMRVSTNYTAREIFLTFDTASLSGADVSAAALTLYGTGQAEQNANSFNLEARALTWGPTLTTGDWKDESALSGATLCASMAVSAWNQTNNAANALTSQSGFPGAINVAGGSTDLVLCLSGMSAGNPPSGINVITTYLADQSGTSSDPLLVVTYEPGANDGTVAATLQEALFSGTGAQTQTGTITATLQAATASITGAQVQSGSVSATMQAASFSGTGEQELDEATGTMAGTLRPATASLVGFMEPSGTVAATLQAALFTGEGEQAQTGAVAAVLQAATSAATGEHAQSGALAAALQAALFAGTAAQTQSGSVAATLQPATVAVVGVMEPSGAIVVTMQPSLFTGAATQAQIGTLAPELRPLLFTGAGTQTQTGSIAAVLEKLLFTANGLIPVIYLVGDARFAPFATSNARFAISEALIARYAIFGTADARYAAMEQVAARYRPQTDVASRYSVITESEARYD